MHTPPRVLVAVLALACLAGLSGCDKAREMAGRAIKERAAGSPAQQAPAAGGVPVAQVPATTGPRVVDLGEADHAAFVARQDGLVIVDFHASWCAPCRALGPVLERLVMANPAVRLGKVDVDRAPRLAAAQQVNGIPDVRFYKKGVEVERFRGFPGEGELAQLIAKHAGGLPPVKNAPARPAAPALTPASKDWLPPGMQRR